MYFPVISILIETRRTSDLLLCKSGHATAATDATHAIVLLSIYTPGLLLRILVSSPAVINFSLRLSLICLSLRSTDRRRKKRPLARHSPVPGTEGEDVCWQLNLRIKSHADVDSGCASFPIGVHYSISTDCRMLRIYLVLFHGGSRG